MVRQCGVVSVPSSIHAKADNPKYMGKQSLCRYYYRYNCHCEINKTRSDPQTRQVIKRYHHIENHFRFIVRDSWWSPKLWSLLATLRGWPSERFLLNLNSIANIVTDYNKAQQMLRRSSWRVRRLLKGLIYFKVLLFQNVHMCVCVCVCARAHACGTTLTLNCRLVIPILSYSSHQQALVRTN
jgi:hypothetical protein